MKLELTETVNATIAETKLGYEGGVFTCYINLRGDAWAQSFGGYRLDAPPGSLLIPITYDLAYGIIFIKSILNAVGVREWEKLPGKNIRIKRTHDKIYEIGHFLEDRWFNPNDLKHLLTPS